VTAATDLSVELGGVALRVAREAAALVRRRRESPVEVADTKSSPVDVVTEADRASEELLRTLLLAARPDDAFLGEEGGDGTGTTGVRWVVDPIDGTVNFLYGLPQYAVSVAAELDGEVVAGVVINAATGTEYAATLGGGATRDGHPIRVRPVVPLSERLVITGFNYDARIRTLQGQAAARLLPRVRDLRRLGSSALDLCFVGDGYADAYVEEGVHLWDHAVGALVVREAGGRTRLVPGIGGTDAMVAASADGFDEFLAAVTEAGFLA
jgi:myo-inositol-1(or 4)-monophosphatase